MKTEANISEFDKKLNANRHGLICIVILIVGCMGGIATGYRAVDSALELSFVVIPTMVTLSLLLAVAPMRWILKAAATSVIIDLLLVSYYFIAG